MKGRIVVGVDGSEESKAALRFAVEEARLRRSTVTAVHAWRYASGGLYTYYTGGLGEQLGGSAAVRGELEEEWLSRFVRKIVHAPDVELAAVAVAGDPSRVLLEAAKGADLLVLGSRRHGGFAGLLLGSVSQQCAHHAPCPVAIVRRFGKRHRHRARAA